MPIETTSAPPVLSMARRGERGEFIDLGHDALPQPIIVRGALDRAQDADMRAATAFQAVDSASLISASVGFFLSRRNAAAVMIQPLMQ